MEIFEKDIDELIEYANNPRNNDNAVDAVAASIKEFGFKQPIVIDAEGVVVAGHTRLKAAKKLKLKTVPCVIADDLTPAQVKAYRLADNKVGELATWDFEKLELEIADTPLDMVEFGFVDEEQRFRENMKRADEVESNEEYDEFLQKFEAKKTTDDCYTPQNIYDAVAGYVERTFDVNRKNFIRPFYPGGDYKSENYAGKIVVDNPPFSILAEIIRWYCENGVRFFLFAPTLTLFSSNVGEAEYVPCGAQVTYENGANVNTSFINNLGEYRIRIDHELYDAVKEQNDINLAETHKELPKYEYPVECVLAAKIYLLAKYGQKLNIPRSESYFKRELDAQKEAGKGAFGSLFLISEKAAAEKAAAEKAAAEKAAAEKAAAEKWELSDKEREIIKNLGK